VYFTGASVPGGRGLIQNQALMVKWVFFLQFLMNGHGGKENL